MTSLTFPFCYLPNSAANAPSNPASNFAANSARSEPSTSPSLLKSPLNASASLSNVTTRMGVSGSFDGISKSAIFSPVDMGEKTTSTVHFPDPSIVCPEQRSFSMKNSGASTPVIPRVPISRSEPPALVTVKNRVFDKPTSAGPGTLHNLLIISSVLSVDAPWGRPLDYKFLCSGPKFGDADERLRRFLRRQVGGWRQKPEHKQKTRL